MGDDADQRSGPALLVSPHLDDAVLSCGRLMAVRPGCTVLTALAGRPTAWTVPTPWDAACGFSPGHDVIGTRLSEDRQALGVLAGHQRTLEGLDSQYGAQPGRGALIRTGIESALTDLQPAMALIPLGLQHEDHIETRQQALLVASRSESPVDWIVYEDLPYGPHDRDGRHHDRAFAAFAAAGCVLTETTLAVDTDMGAKAQAVECYSSQLVALRGFDDRFDQAIVTERYWELTRD